MKKLILIPVLALFLIVISSMVSADCGAISCDFFIAYDDFNRTDSGTVGNGWVEEGGNTQIKNEMFYSIADNSRAYQDVSAHADTSTYSMFVVQGFGSFGRIYNGGTNVCRIDVSQGGSGQIDLVGAGTSTFTKQVNSANINLTFVMEMYDNNNTCVALLYEKNGTLIEKEAQTFGGGQTTFNRSYIWNNARPATTPEWGYVDNYSAWNGSVSEKPNGTLPAAAENVTIISPANNTHNNSVTFDIVFNTTMLGSPNCTLYLNGTANNTIVYNNSLGSNIITSTNLSQEAYLWFVNCNNGTDDLNSSARIFVSDLASPGINDNSGLDGGTFTNATVNISVTIGADFLFASSVNATCSNGTNIYTNFTSYDGTWQSNTLTDQINNTLCGTSDTINVFIQAADTHTNQKIAHIPHTTQGTELVFEDDIKIYPAGTEFSSVSTQKLRDRHTFTYQRSKNTPQKYDDFYVEAGNIVQITQGKYANQGHFVIWNGFGKSKWLDFATDEGYPVLVTPISKGKYRVRVYSNGDSDLKFKSLGGLNENSINITYSYDTSNVTITETFGTLIFEGDTTRLTANISYNNLIYDGIDSAVLEWNNTNFTAALINRGNSSATINFSNYSQLINVPSYEGINGTQVNHRWYVTMSLAAGGSTVINTSLQSQTILEFTIAECTAGQTPSMRFFLRDEVNDTLTNSDFEFFNIFTTPTGAVKNFSTTLSGNDTYLICITPNNVTLTSNITIRYEATGYDARNWYKRVHPIDNTTEDVNLYLLASASSTQITVHVVDEDDDDLPDVQVEAWLFDIGNGTEKLVEVGSTNSLGETFLNLDTTQQYTFRLFRNGVLVLQSQTAEITDTTIEFTIVDVSGSRFTQLIDIRGIGADLDYENSSRTLTFTWNDASNVSETFIYLIVNTNGTVIFNENSTNKTGSIAYSFSVAQMNTTYYAQGSTINFQGNGFLLAERSLDFRDLWKTFGSEGVMYALLIYLVIALMGIQFPGLALILGGVAFIFIYMIGFIPMGYSILIWALSIIVIALMFTRKNK